MKLIHSNPYRIVGVLSNATERELQKQQTKIKAYSRVGKEIKSEYDFNILEGVTRTENSIGKAFSNIEQNQDKINYALFWFLNASPFDNTALEYLKNGDEEKAVEIWEKVTLNKDVNSNIFSAFNNLGTLKLLSNSEIEIKQGIEVKIKLIESDYFEDFVHSVADETFTIDNKKQVQKLIDELLLQFKNQYSSSEILQLFSNCKGSTQKYISQKITEEPIHNIESQIESAKSKRKENKSGTYEFGLKLYTNCKDDLSILKSLLGESDLKYKTIADQFANEIMQCGIDYFNYSKENDSSENYLESAKNLTKIADRIAVGKLTKDRAKDSLSTLVEMKDKELLQALDILNSIKSAFDRNKAKINTEVMSMPMSYNQSVNWSKVSQMIKNSLDWDKVVELVLKSITPSNVEKIKLMDDTAKLKEYKLLVDFLVDKLSYSQISKVKYLAYWTKEDAISSVRFTAKSMPDEAKWVASVAVGLLIVGLIWGKEGFEVIFGIAAFIGLIYLLGNQK